MLLNFREVCLWRLSTFNERIGGIGKTVEIDETKLFKRKNHTGRMVGLSGWLFGGIEREDKTKMFMVLVPDRTAETLISCIQQYISPGTRIISDCWAAYNQIQASGFDHQTVNHSYNFVCPENPEIYTQNIEITWRYLKEICRTTSPDENMLIYRIAEFMYRRKYKNECIFSRILFDISENYSPLNF